MCIKKDFVLNLKFTKCRRKNSLGLRKRLTYKFFFLLFHKKLDHLVKPLYERSMFCNTYVKSISD